MLVIHQLRKFNACQIWNVLLTHPTTELNHSFCATERFSRFNEYSAVLHEGILNHLVLIIDCNRCELGLLFTLKIFLERFWEILPVYYNYMFWRLKRIIFGKAWRSVPWFRQCMHIMITSMRRIWKVMFSLSKKRIKLFSRFPGLFYFFGWCGVYVCCSLSSLSHLLILAGTIIAQQPSRSQAKR